MKGNANGNSGVPLSTSSRRKKILKGLRRSALDVPRHRQSRSALEGTTSRIFGCRQNRRHQMQNFGDFFLPAWLLGFPFLLAILDRMMIGGPRSPLTTLDFDDRPRAPGLAPTATL
jgi:hypothetical protein